MKAGVAAPLAQAKLKIARHDLTALVDVVAGTPTSLQALSRIATPLLPPKVNRGCRAGEKPFDPSNPFPVGAIVASKVNNAVPHGKSAPIHSAPRARHLGPMPAHSFKDTLRVRYLLSNSRQ